LRRGEREELTAEEDLSAVVPDGVEFGVELEKV
jgi:hypothetical protein